MIKVVKRNGNVVEFLPEKLKFSNWKGKYASCQRKSFNRKKKSQKLVDSVVKRIPEDTEIQ